MPIPLEPDQVAARWDEHAAIYEAVFEPFTVALSGPALAFLQAVPGQSVLDVGAGPGGLALALARSGHGVTAIDAAPAMVARIAERAAAAGLDIDARVGDAMRLQFGAATFDAAISAFAIVLLPDAPGALRELARVVRRRGRIAVVTWTEPDKYELAAMLGAAIAEACPDRPRPPLPAQLRYRERQAFLALFSAAGLPPPQIEVVEAHLEAPSAHWLLENISFAPGMAALMASLGRHRDEVLAAFADGLRWRFADGPVRLGGRAFVGTTEKS